ncbi:MAG TPA: ATP-binding protein [Polyangiaceae bacterium]|jgi:two-component system sensor histidine kinase RegB|nr:ATP-binding protein [Polyangiaceae bacterium]
MQAPSREYNAVELAVSPAAPRERGGADDEVHRINMSWLVRLRWATILGQALLIVVVHFWAKIRLPLEPLAGILSLEAAVNVGATVWLRRAARVGEAVIALALAADVCCFTGLLYFTGGPMNPFSFLYLVHIALAALVLPPRWTWPLVLLSVSASAALFVRHVPLPMDAFSHAHHHMTANGEPLSMHLRGMWVAFATAAAFIVYFMHRVTRALADREVDLARARDRGARTEKLASMATLAAGAAHELGTPLATIAVVAKELERPVEQRSVAEDARLIRQQVERCRSILSQMAGDAGESPGELPSRIALSVLVRAAIERLPAPARVRIEWARGVDADGAINVPLHAVTRALRNVLKNGIDASDDAAEIVLQVLHGKDGGVVFEVVDFGAGMSPEVLSRATEPFFTTKDSGRGMGLGLYLTRTVFDLLGGKLDIESKVGRGTRVLCTLPAACIAMRSPLVAGAS